MCAAANSAAGDNGDAHLILGPLLRYVDENRATIWFETHRPCDVDVVTATTRRGAPTWTVHGHHYALVRLEDLPRCTTTEYAVELDGRSVWPLSDSTFPPSVIRTPDPDAPYRLAFGSCRRSAPFDDASLRKLGADALVGLAGRMVEQSHGEWPDILLFLGDQVYADDPSEAVLERLREAHGDRDSEIAGEIQNFEEYTWLYHEAWMVPEVRWLMSTVPVGTMFDDHDLRDDWNTSLSWRREVTSKPWWRDRVTGAYASYWVYQHLGNLSPEQLDEDEVYGRLLAITDDDERSRLLDEMAWRADQDPSTVRWSFARDLGGAARGVRLVAIDSRCSRHLEPDDRRMVDADEWDWVRHAVLDDRPYEHLVLGSTLPFLLLPGIHHMEAWDEAISSGAWGRSGKWVGEKLRQGLDLEHWASFQESFDEFTDLLGDVVRSPIPPATILMLSGDVHCSYTAVAELDGVDHPETAMYQLTMSPFRNDIQRVAKAADKLLNRKFWTSVMHRLSRRSGVDDVAMSWQVDHGVWFDNGVMTIDFGRRSAQLGIDHAHVDSGVQRLERTMDVELAGEPTIAPGTPDGATAAV